MPSTGFEPRPYGIAVSFTNHYTGWVARDVLKHGPTGPGPRPHLRWGPRFFLGSVLGDRDPDNFNGQILFPYIFSEKQEISKCMSIGKSGKTVLLCGDRCPCLSQWRNGEY
ncbi:hypothetical protein TNCV_570041 [Trichonephila clavipes]|nr:hypothetical protein TNCV_570041 [Trichonephila clavipes]